MPAYPDLAKPQLLLPLREGESDVCASPGKKSQSPLALSFPTRFVPVGVQGARAEYVGVTMPSTLEIEKGICAPERKQCGVEIKS